MKKMLLSLFALTFFLTDSISQIRRCATYESMQEYRQQHPGAATDEQFEAWMRQKTQERLQASQRTTIAYTIPIVFHLVHNGEAVGTGSNLSAAMIQQQLNQLNADFANSSGSPYGSVSANSEIQFCLAVVGPDGKALAEPGINRINRNTRGWSAPPYNGSSTNSYVDVTIMPNSIWDPYKYFNVWVLDLGSTLLGKATFPTASTLSGLSAGETDTHAGVMIHYASVGSVFSPGPFGNGAGLGRTLTHELGHSFGLRHIWGDGPCATDYCNDTPPQDASTSGCPAGGTLNNCTPSGPKMFENYMDYTNDNCVNTLTVDQVARMQTVMLNSPRRKELATAGTCTTPPLNSIRFSMSSLTVSEAGTVLTCPRYREVVVDLNVFGAATGAATVTFTRGGTATNTVDYTVTPASVTYANGDGSSKQVTIRIWDDGVIEGTETLTLGYTISGGGVIAANANQVFTLTIADNDLLYPISTTGTATLLEESFGTSGGNLPLGWTTVYFGALPVQNRWTVSTNGGAGTTGQSVHVTNDLTNRPTSYTKTDVSQIAVVTPVVSAAGYSDLRLTFNYRVGGELFSGTIYDYGSLVYTYGGDYFLLPDPANGGAQFRLQGQTGANTMSNLALPSDFTGTPFRLGFFWVNDNTDGTDPGFVIDDVRITGTVRRVESDAAGSGSESISSGQDVYLFSSSDNQLIARLRNPTATLGCVTATVTAGGTGQVAISTTSGSYQRTQKVYQVVPSSGANATYELTLYFTNAELSAWGANRLNLKFLKVNDGVSLSSTLNSSNSTLVTPTSVVENTAGGYVAYTATFTGFSQFVLVSPNLILPVNLLTFEAKAAQKAIELKWQTGTERNNKGFIVERSTDGADFARIGWVNGAGDANQAVTYRYTDHFVQPNVLYYYRLKQVDFDSRQQLSEIRQARISKSALTLSLSPNPGRDVLRVFVSGGSGTAEITLINAKGQEVGRWSKANPFQAPFALPVGRFARGTYTVVVRFGEQRLTAQAMLE
jgi:hypothetical protein